MTQRRPGPIWFLIGSLEVGGTEHTLVDLANELVASGLDVAVWTIKPVNPLAPQLDEAVTYRTLDAGGKADIRAAISFLAAVRREQPAILQSFLFYDNLLARLAKLIRPRTVVISGIRAVPDNPSPIRSLFDRFTMPLADYVVSNSNAGAEVAVDRGASPRAVHVIHTGRDVSRYGDTDESETVRASCSIPTEAPLVGTVGRFIHRKGHHDLLAAWSTVREEHNDAHLLLVGDGPRRDELHRQSETLGIQDTVHFAGLRDDIPELLASMDVFTFPSHFEGLPGALIEAMAAGLPIVATSVVGNKELITHKRNGLLVQPHEPEELAAGINRLLADREFARTLGDHAADTAASEFSLDAMVGEFVALYEEVASEYRANRR